MVNLHSATRIANFSVALSTLAFVMGQAPQAKALTFEFDYSYDDNNFFSGSEGTARRTTLESAADYFEPFTDNLSAITDSDSDSTDIGLTGKTSSTTGLEIENTWSATFTDPGDGTSVALPDFTVAEDTLTIFVGGRNLSGDAIGLATTGFTSSGLTDFRNNIRSRGQSGALDNPKTDYATWGGSIAFDNTVTWNNSDTTSPASGENDLLSVAIHELAHILGAGSADSWDDQIDSDNNTFTGFYSNAEFGGDVPLATDPDTGNPDTGHWANGTKSTIDGIGDFETAFDPSLTEGTRKILTDLDYAGLTDVGWETQAVYSAAVPFEFSPGLGIFVVSGVFGINKAWRNVKKQQAANIK